MLHRSSVDTRMYSAGSVRQAAASRAKAMAMPMHISWQRLDGQGKPLLPGITTKRFLGTLTLSKMGYWVSVYPLWLHSKILVGYIHMY